MFPGFSGLSTVVGIAAAVGFVVYKLSSKYSAFDAIESLAQSGALNDVSVAKISSDGREIGEIQKELLEDGMQRLKVLESGVCPTP